MSFTETGGADGTDIAVLQTRQRQPGRSPGAPRGLRRAAGRERDLHSAQRQSQQRPDVQAERLRGPAADAVLRPDKGALRTRRRRDADKGRRRDAPAGVAERCVRGLRDVGVARSHSVVRRESADQAFDRGKCANQAFDQRNSAGQGETASAGHRCYGRAVLRPLGPTPARPCGSVWTWLPSWA